MQQSKKDLDQERKLAEWCYEQDKAFWQGKLKQWQVDMLKKINFPFGKYYNEKEEICSIAIQISELVHFEDSAKKQTFVLKVIKILKDII